MAKDKERKERILRLLRTEKKAAHPNILKTSCYILLDLQGEDKFSNNLFRNLVEKLRKRAMALASSQSQTNYNLGGGAGEASSSAATMSTATLPVDLELQRIRVASHEFGKEEYMF